MSEKNNKAGRLCIMSTPIGNLEDITFRAVRTLKEADLVAAEDTRRAQKLLNHFEIKVKTVSYHSHNEHMKTEWLLDQVEEGLTVVILSDAGTPCIADPGFLAVREAVKRSIEPEVIPGVSALTFAAVAAGLPVVNFTFWGFIPVKKGRRTATLQKIEKEQRTAFLYESPHRMDKLLRLMADVMHTDTQVSVIREATKIYEEVLRGTPKEIITQVGEKKWKGECVVVIAPVVVSEKDTDKNKKNRYKSSKQI